MILLISYDLNGHERPSSYTDVKKIIEEGAADWKRPLYSQWFVETDDSVVAWRDALKKVIDSDDHLFIIQVKHPYNGWLPKSIWPWLRERI